jgi:hypothetical protein
MPVRWFKFDSSHTQNIPKNYTPILKKHSDTGLHQKVRINYGSILKESTGRLLGPTKENNPQRIRYNNELYKQFEEPSISNIIKLKRLQWAGHIWRMDGKRIPKRI